VQRKRESLAAAAAIFGATLLALGGCASGGSGVTAPASGHSPAASSTVVGQRPSSSGSAPRSPARQGLKSSAAALVVLHDPGRVSGTLTGPCHARDYGRLPDPHCTPGGIDPAVTQANIRSTICVSGYTSRVRPPEAQTEAFKFSQAYPAYGIPAGDQSELDHLVPLELGGDNAAANLWPETGSVPNPKDDVEYALNRAVCDRRVSLTSAQRAIARNWETAESGLGIGAPVPVPPPAPTSTQPAAGLSCRASVSNSSPADYTTVNIYVHTAAGALVTTVAHYKTTDHQKTAAATSAGQATIAYYVSGAAPGYTVVVDVTSAAGGRSAHCSTSFTPVR
jgi:hypothetical protein